MHLAAKYVLVSAAQIHIKMCENLFPAVFFQSIIVRAVLLLLQGLFSGFPFFFLPKLHITIVWLAHHALSTINSLYVGSWLCSRCPNLVSSSIDQSLRCIPLQKSVQRAILDLRDSFADGLVHPTARYLRTHEIILNL